MRAFEIKKTETIRSASAAVVACAFMVSACASTTPSRRLSSAEITNTRSSQSRITAEEMIHLEAFRLLLFMSEEDPKAYQALMSELNRVDWEALQKTAEDSDEAMTISSAGFATTGASLALLSFAGGPAPVKDPSPLRLVSTASAATIALGLGASYSATQGPFTQANRRKHEELVLQEITLGKTAVAQAIRGEISFYAYLFDLPAKARNRLEKAVARQLHEKIFLSPRAETLTVDVFKELSEQKLVSQEKIRSFLDLRAFMQRIAQDSQASGLELDRAFQQEDVVAAYQDLVQAIRAEMLSDKKKIGAEQRRRIDEVISKSERLIWLIEAAVK